MKTTQSIIATVALIAVIAFSAGCATTGKPPLTDQQKATRVATVAELAAYDGTLLWLAKHPEDRKYFELSRDALNVLVNADKISPAELTGALSNLPIKQLQGPDGAVIVGSAVILYDAFLRENVNLDSNVYLRPVATALLAGLNRGLGPK